MKKGLFIIVLVICFTMLAVPCFAEFYPKHELVHSGYYYVYVKIENGVYSYTESATPFFKQGTGVKTSSTMYSALSSNGISYSTMGEWDYKTAVVANVGQQFIVGSSHDIWDKDENKVFFWAKPPIAVVAQVLPNRVAVQAKVLIPVGLVIFSIILLLVLLKRWRTRLVRL